MSDKALRFNSGKIKLSMVPPSLTAYTAAGLQYGEIKYTRDNWRRGFSWNSILDSLQRHLDAFKEGENYDSESHLHHLCHVGCNVAFLIEHIERGLGTDDRFKRNQTGSIFIHADSAPDGQKTLSRSSDVGGDEAGMVSGKCNSSSTKADAVNTLTSSL